MLLLKALEARNNISLFVYIQEQERRRQHMLLLKALEARKKQEEKEKQKEERIAERRMHRERKEVGYTVEYFS